MTALLRREAVELDGEIVVQKKRAQRTSAAQMMRNLESVQDGVRGMAVGEDGMDRAGPSSGQR